MYMRLLETGTEIALVVGRVLDQSRLITTFLLNLLTIFQLCLALRNEGKKTKSKLFSVSLSLNFIFYTHCPASNCLASCGQCFCNIKICLLIKFVVVVTVITHLSLVFMISPQSPHQSFFVTLVKGTGWLLDMQSFKFRQANQSLHLLPVSGDKIPALGTWCMRILFVPTSDIVQYISEMFVCRCTRYLPTRALWHG